VRRKLFNLAAAVSLVLCVATVALWIASYFVGMGAEWVSPSASLALDVGCSFGTMSIAKTEHAAPDATLARLRGFSYYVHAPRPPLPQLAQLVGPFARFDFRFGGFAIFFYGPPDPHGTSVLWPCWAAALVTSILPVAWFITRKKPAGNLCRNCGYDLRATPDRCPECGTEAKPQSTEGAAA
jgi:hypothetical protein